ncbi:MAG: ATP-binding protein [Bacteroidia bacterium]|nr:ATP-binding protein [Bacteroidia bacterium]
MQFFPALGIIGPRQVGKTTLAHQLRPQLPKKSLYLDLELDSDRFKLSRAEWYLSQHADVCVIIDEVQRMPELFPLLRALIDRQREPGRFLLLGSAAPAMLRNASESLAGRIAYQELAPFSLAELHAAPGMIQHWIRGGFPDAVLAPDLDRTWDWYRAFVQSFIERDLGISGIEVNPVLFERLLRMLGHVHGGQQRISELVSSLGIAASTVSRYLDVLENSFLIARLQPWFVNLGKRLVKSPKLYIRDSGLLHYLLHIRDLDQLQGNPRIGASWEGYAIEQIRRTMAGKARLYYYRTQSGAEMDLVLENAAGSLYCFEIKYDVRPAPSKGFYHSIADLKPAGSYLLVPYGESWSYGPGITVTGLEAFLLHELPGLLK